MELSGQLARIAPAPQAWKQRRVGKDESRAGSVYGEPFSMFSHSGLTLLKQA